MPEVPHPDKLPSEAELKSGILPQIPEAMRRYFARQRPIELRPVESAATFGQKPHPASTSGSAPPASCPTIRRSTDARWPMPRT